MRVVEATQAHIWDFLKRPIRQADVDEWVSGSGVPVAYALTETFGFAPEVAAFTRALLNEEGHCISLWGVVPGPGDNEANVWLIASVEAEGRAKAIHRLFREEIDWMHSIGERLHAWTSAANSYHHYWMERVGFQFKAVRPYGPLLQPFYIYERTPECVVR